MVQLLEPLFILVVVPAVMVWLVRKQVRENRHTRGTARARVAEAERRARGID